MKWVAAFGPLRTLTTVGFSPPFALSLSKGQAEPVEAFVPRAKGFDKLSPNGSLPTLKFAFVPKPASDDGASFTSFAPSGSEVIERPKRQEAGRSERSELGGVIACRCWPAR
jgi:hypothetical protein